MDDEDMNRLLTFYNSGIVPSLDQIRLGTSSDVPYTFDGSFGWC